MTLMETWFRPLTINIRLMKTKLFLLSFLVSYTLLSQSISGSRSVQPGTQVTYVFGGGIVSNPNWHVVGGSIESETNTEVIVQWGSGPTGLVEMRDGNQPYFNINVSITTGSSGGGDGDGGIFDPNEPPPAPPAPVISANYCGDKTLTFDGDPPVGVSWYWQGINQLGDNEDESPSRLVGSSRTEYIRAHSANGWSTTATGIFVTVNDMPSEPDPPAKSSNTCGPITLYKGTPPEGVDWFWQTTEAGENVNENGDKLISSSKTVYLKAKSDEGCWGDARAVSVTINGYPSPPSVFQDKFCGYTQVRVVTPSGIGHTWQQDTLVFYDSDTLTISAFNESTGCQSWVRPVFIDVGEVPSVAELTMNANCDSYDISYPSPQANHTYELWDSDDVLVPENSTADWTVNEPGIYSFKVINLNVAGCVMSQPLGTYFNSINEVEVTSILKAATTLANVGTLPSTQKSSSKTYLDGIGRPIQNVAKGNSPLGKDVIFPVYYDEIGRQSIKYLPYVSLNDTGSYDQNALDEENYSSSNQFLFYTGAENIAHDSKPYAVSIFDESPSNLIIEQGAAGQSWQPDQASVKFNYDRSALDVENWVLNEQTDLPIDLANGVSVHQKTITDEEGHKTLEFTNRFGQTVLKRVQAHANGETAEWANTYYVYDDYGNLRYVIPPEAHARLTTNEPDVVFLNRWCFQYRYDGRKRMIEKKVPGSEWIYMVYDQRDRLVLTQDGNQRDQEQWLYTKYDALNRPVATGILSDAQTRVGMQSTVDSYYSSMDASKAWYETYVANATGNAHGYDLKSFPSTVNAADFLTVSYYDTYDFTQLADFGVTYDFDPSQLSCVNTPRGNICFPSESLDAVKGQVTGSKTRILESSNFLNAVHYFDSKTRLIQTISNDHLGQVRKTSSLVNFPGWLIATNSNQELISGGGIAVKKRFEYDHAGRLLRGYHEILESGASNGEFLIAENIYNELGELIEKNLHVENGQAQQSLDYRYNIRGWLKNINTGSLLIEPGKNENDLIKDLFGMEIFYNEQFSGLPE